MRKIGLILTVALMAGGFGAAAMADDLGNGGGKNPGDSVNGGSKCLKNCSVKMNADASAKAQAAASVKPGVKAVGDISGPKPVVPPKP